MGFLPSRFTFNGGGTGNQFHSSGVVGGETVTGSASTQSFSQRQRINAQRQTIGGYRDAGVVHGYRHDAVVSGAMTGSSTIAASAAASAQAGEQPGPPGQRLNYHDRQHAKNATPERVGFSRTSKIDVVTSSRQDYNAGNTQQPTAAAHSTMPARFKPSFTEPTSRPYNPYQ